MKALTLRWPAQSAADFHAVVRAARLYECPRAAGLMSRHLSAAGGGLRGEYLFENEADADRFVGKPTIDPAVELAARIAACAPSVGPIVDVPPDDIIDRPIFIVAAPRAGGQLLLDLLAASSQFWTIAGGTAGIVEGTSGLHPASAHWDSHRLTDADANATVVRAVRTSVAIELRPCETAVASPRLLERTCENALRVPFLAAAFPDARFIFIHRDARQNVSSMLHAWHDERAITIPQLPGWNRGAWHLLLPPWWRDYQDAPLVDVAAFQWAAANERALDDLEWLAPDRWVFVDYGELIAAPRRVAERVMALAGLDVDEALETALTRPYPLGSPPPSPIQWRSNPQFRESALAPHNVVRGRLREYGGEPARPPDPARATQPVKFGCFLDEVCVEPAPTDPDWIVHPSYRLQVGATVPMGLARRARFREQFVRDQPIAWIEDSATRVLYPFVAGREHIAVLRRFIAGEPAPPVSHQMAAQLATVGIFVTPSVLARTAEDANARARMARAQLAEQRYCLLPAIMHSDQVAALARYYDRIIASGNWTFGDAQVSHRYGWHNEPVARYYHHQLSAYVGEIAGVPVRPSYSYVSAYRGGRASLRPHVDRKQCVYTISLWLRSRESPAAEPWPLWLHSPQGIVAVTQSAGDAILFHGCELPHWRDQPPPGGASTTLIFHYVPNDFLGTLD